MSRLFSEPPVLKVHTHYSSLRTKQLKTLTLSCSLFKLNGYISAALEMCHITEVESFSLDACLISEHLAFVRLQKQVMATCTYSITAINTNF